MTMSTPIHDVFPHVRIIMGIVVGLGITRLLIGSARFVQHPGRERPSAIHLAWVISMLLMLAHFWWWEFWLYDIGDWVFSLYIFLIGYTVALFLLCALLYPDDIREYKNYEDYFLSRRKWFFGLLALVFVFDIADTLWKGEEHLLSFGPEYPIRAGVYIVLCVAAMGIANRRFHQVFAAANLIYQISFILRQFDRLT